MGQRYTLEGVASVIGLLLLLSACVGPESAGVGRKLVPPPTIMPDVSGLAWIEGDAFLAVHDAKVPEEEGRPRVSIIDLPRSGGALRWTPLDVRWPPSTGPSHDLESIARVPGTSTYLLVESGDGGSPHRRIFVADLTDRALAIRDVAEWPMPIVDIEGTSVARLDDVLYFVFAERAHGASSTGIAWARLTLEPLRLGDIREVELSNPMRPSVDTRPVSALEIDDEGRVWAASAFDPGSDIGPFRSAVWEIGRFAEGPDGEGHLRLQEEPSLVARLDGLKEEGISVRGIGRGAAVFIGTDDEDFGGALRRLAIP